MSRLRSVVVLVGLVIVVALLAGLSVLDPFHLRHARWFTSGLIGLALVLLTAAIAVVARRGVLRTLVVVVGVVAVLVWGGFVVGASRLASMNTEMARVPGDGGRNLVVLRGTGSTVDPAYAVVLRAGGGPFEQESLIYQGPESAPQPSARFIDGRTVEVSLGGCRYTSTVEAVTLAVEPVHRPLLAGQC